MLTEPHILQPADQLRHLDEQVIAEHTSTPLLQQYIDDPAQLSATEARGVLKLQDDIWSTERATLNRYRSQQPITGQGVFDQIRPKSKYFLPPALAGAEWIEQEQTAGQPEIKEVDAILDLDNSDPRLVKALRLSIAAMAEAEQVDTELKTIKQDKRTVTYTDRRQNEPMQRAIKLLEPFDQRPPHTYL